MTEIDEKRVERREIGIGNGYFVRDNGRLYGWGLHDEDGDCVAMFNNEWSATTFATITNSQAAIALADREAAERIKGDVWTEWERLRDKAFGLAKAAIGSHVGMRAWGKDGPAARAALDAFVRRHIALAEAGGAVPEFKAAMDAAWRKVIAYPFSKVCKHLVASNMLSDMEQLGFVITREIADAVVNADDETALAYPPFHRTAAPRPPAVGTEKEGGGKA